MRQKPAGRQLPVLAGPARLLDDYRAARRYVAGETRDQALEAARQLGAGGITASVDCFGELVTGPTTAEHATADYVQLAKTVARVEDAWLAIDLSHVGLDLSVDFCRR